MKFLDASTNIQRSFGPIPICKHIYYTKINYTSGSNLIIKMTEDSRCGRARQSSAFLFFDIQTKQGIRCSVIEVIVCVLMLFLAGHERKPEHRIKIKFDADIETNGK